MASLSYYGEPSTWSTPQEHSYFVAGGAWWPWGFWGQACVFPGVASAPG